MLESQSTTDPILILTTQVHIITPASLNIPISLSNITFLLKELLQICPFVVRVSSGSFKAAKFSVKKKEKDEKRRKDSYICK